MSCSDGDKTELGLKFAAENVAQKKKSDLDVLRVLRL